MDRTPAAPSPPVAIVGMDCLFPGAPDLDTYWENLRTGFDAITTVPESRWESLYYDPGSTDVDRFYCRRGGFVDEHARFDPMRFGIMPVAAEAAEPDQLLTLRVAAGALEDAGVSLGDPRCRSAGVVLGRGGYLSVGMTRLIQQVRSPEQLVATLRSLVPRLTGDELATIKRAFADQVPPVGPATAIGLVPNLAASRVANRLDLHGPAFTVDAACASSLVAVDQACRELASGRCDLMLAGGVHLTHDSSFWSVFCQLGVLSHSETIRPFDERADGLLMGEGVGVVALRRLADAERDGDRIYAVIHGCGVSSDGRRASLMEPGADGQVEALRLAWAGAGVDPDRVGLIEAHGTGTVAGDETELETLRRFFGAPAGPERAGLGSVKSMIGHTMPAAGAAGLIKAALAVYHGVRPPTLHADRPHEALADTRFRLIQQAEPWDEEARWAGVNAFGFGGINAHVVLGSGPAAAKPRSRRLTPTDAGGELFTLAASTPGALLEALAEGGSGGRGGCRLAILDPTPSKLAQAQRIVSRGKRWPGRSGIWFTPDGLLGAGGRLAYLFPGVDASFKPRVKDVAGHFGEPVPEHLDADGLEEIGLGIVEVSRLMDRVLGRLGLAPEAMAGHSIGEWTGMICSGLIPEAEIDALIARLKPGTLQVPGVAFAALGCGRERAEEAIRGLPEIAVSHDNCPHQCLLCGVEQSVRIVTDRLRSEGVLCQVLPFRSGFHSPLFADYLGMHREHFGALSLVDPRVTLWSATTCAPYPTDPAAIRALTIRHLVEPVRFRELVEALYDEGFRAFVQVGSGSLVGFVGDTLKGREHLAISANVPRRTGLEQLRHLAAAIWVEGGAVELEPLFAPRQAPTREIALALGAPLVELDPKLTLTTDGPASLELEGSPEEAGPVWEALNALTREIDDTRRDVMAALRKSRDPLTPKTFTHTLSVHAVPALWDHCFFNQPEGYTSPADAYPVVPMTLSIQLMMDAARAVMPGRVVVAVEDVEAFKWLVVEPEREVTLHARPLDGERVQVSLEGFARADVILADSYPEAPPPRTLELAAPAPSPIDAPTLYRDRWMFHGPQYQGVLELGPIGDEGIHGELEAPSGPGGLLDNAGQLFGYWVMAKQDEDRLAMPQRIGRLDFYGPEPGPGSRLACDVWIRMVDDREVIADLQLTEAGSPWCAITGWSDHRFASDAAMWNVMLHPEVNTLSERDPAGWVLYDDGEHRAPSRDWLARRYLSQVERQAMRDSGPRRARAWLNGRIAAKDAVRLHLWQREQRPLFPIELQLDNDDDGAPEVRGPLSGDLRISLSHSGDIAVALVAEGHDPGIDVELVAPRSEEFGDVAFTPGEQELLGADDTGEWATRFWCAKEAVAKARRTGLGGNPHRFVVTRVEGERLLLDGLWVDTIRRGDHVIAWTEA